MTPVRARRAENWSHVPERAFDFPRVRPRRAGVRVRTEEPRLIEVVSPGRRNVGDGEEVTEATVHRLPLPVTRDVEGDSELSAREFVESRGLEELLSTCQDLLVEVFGADAQLIVRLDRDRETGERRLVAEAHYGMGGDEIGLDDLAERDEEFLTRYIQEVPAEDRRRIVLVRLPGNGD